MAINWVKLGKSTAIAFVTSFIGAFLAGLAGVLASPDFSTGKAALVALSMAALISGVNAVRAVFSNAMPADHEVS